MSKKICFVLMMIILFTGCRSQTGNNIDYQALYNEQVEMNYDLIQENEQLESEYLSLRAKLEDRPKDLGNSVLKPADFFHALDRADDSIGDLIIFYVDEMEGIAIGSGYGEAFGDVLLQYYFDLDFNQFMSAILEVPIGRVDRLAAHMITSLKLQYQYEEISDDQYSDFVEAFQDLSKDIELEEDYKQFVYEILAHYYGNY